MLCRYEEGKVCNKRNLFWKNEKKSSGIQESNLNQKEENQRFNVNFVDSNYKSKLKS